MSNVHELCGGYRLKATVGAIREWGYRNGDVQVLYLMEIVVQKSIHVQAVPHFSSLIMTRKE